jgi:hypothetical protein
MITNFSKSFLADVPLPRKKQDAPKDEPCPHCKLSRHFRFALRQVVNKADYLAGIDRCGERFIFAGLDWFQRESVDYKTKKPFDYRMVKACWSKMKELGIVTRAQRVRDGAMRSGWLVVSHDDVTQIQGHVCVWCQVKTSCETSPEPKKTSPETSPILKRTSPRTSPNSEKNFPLDFPSDYPDKNVQPPQNQDIRATPENSAGDFATSFAAPSTVRSELGQVKQKENTGNSERTNSNLKPNSAGSSFFHLTLT